jgi:hypothetical protein
MLAHTKGARGATEKEASKALAMSHLAAAMSTLEVWAWMSVAVEAFLATVPAAEEEGAQEPRPLKDVTLWVGVKNQRAIPPTACSL